MFLWQFVLNERKCLGFGTKDKKHHFNKHEIQLLSSMVGN